MPAMAQDFLLHQPVDCTLGETCYIQNYVDHDPTEAASDFRCGSLTYDAHKGTDFGLPSLSAMNAGVDVLAAAQGTVRGVRNDMRDVYFTPALAGEINGRECGNGVVVAHGDGWETQYCHLKEGSVVVLPGDQVNAGDVLGQVGLSGRTQFPHLHLSVRRDGNIVDPFDPDGVISCGTPSEATLWANLPETPQGGVLSTGFWDGVPDYGSVKAGTAEAATLSPDGPIVLWALVFGARPGDVVSIMIDGPEAPLFATEETLDLAQALVMRAGGLNSPDGGWASGTYTGFVALTRNGNQLDGASTTITVP